MARAKDSLLFAFYQRGGMWKAAKAASYLAAWGLVYEEMGRRPTQQEYCDYWRQSMATGTREVQAFKACVPEGVTVEDVWLHVRAGVAKASGGNRDAAAALVSGARWSA